mgnify:CR=1 FL=1
MMMNYEIQMSNFMDVEDFEKKKFDATAEKKIIHCFSTFDFFFPICNCKCLV